MRFKLQDILWPKAGLCGEKLLYYRLGKNPVHDVWTLEHADKSADTGVRKLGDCGLLFKEDGVASFDTYFNGFSIEKWKKYTILDQLFLDLKIKGKFRVTLYSKQKLVDDLLEKPIFETIIEAKNDEVRTILFPEAYTVGMLCFELTALEDGSCFYGGEFYTEVEEEKIRNVKIAIGVCTFKREAYVTKNIGILNEHIIENQNSDLNGHLEVFVSDNGQTLDIDQLSSEKIHIVKNKNTGGAGGFTRCMIEASRANEKGMGITHMLLMDDDIVIDPESIVKTYKILSLLKEEYKDSFIGGAMLRIDKQYSQVESGAVWNAGRLEPLKMGLDMRMLMDCIYNEWEEYREYNAWWYCCFPMDIVRSDNLPMPIFIRGDDLEYGLRNMKNLILMNGICVWHEPFENKYSSFLEYYIIRNKLIDNSMHCPWYGKNDLKKDMFKAITREIVYYRYKNVDLILRGVADFLKGVDWLLKSDGEKLHKEIMAAGYKAEPLENLDVPFSYPEYDKERHKKSSPINKLKRILTLNGYLLRTRGNVVTSMSSIRPINAYRAKKILQYDVTSKKAFVTEKDNKKLLECYAKMNYMFREIDKRYDTAKKSYQSRCKEVQNIEFWERYLGL